MELLASLTKSAGDDRILLAAILFAGAGETALRSNALFDMVDASMALGPLSPRPALLRQWNLDLGVDTLARLADLSLPVHAVWGTRIVCCRRGTRNSYSKQLHPCAERPSRAAATIQWSTRRTSSPKVAAFTVRSLDEVAD